MIRVEQLSKSYGPARAIDGLAFTVDSGEIVGFLGPNGAGKTTTMRILAGSLAATSGRALVGGVDVFERPRTVKAMVGYLPENPPLYTEMTVRQYLRFAARIKGTAAPDVAVEHTIDRVGLGVVAHRLIAHLSKGFRQRVGLAQALVHSPRVLILDEPSSGLDPEQRKGIRALVKALAVDEVTVILSTHVLPEVEALCDRVIIIHEGRIVAQDSVDALAGSGTAIRVRVARPAAEVADALNAVVGVLEVEPSVDGVYRVSASRDVREAVAAAAVPFGLLELGAQRRLEDVFLRLTGEAS